MVRRRAITYNIGTISAYPTGTTGSVRDKDSCPVGTLFARANCLLNAAFWSSTENVCVSPATAVQVMTAGSDEVQFVGVSMVKAETRGARRAREALRKKRKKIDPCFFADGVWRQYLHKLG